MRLDLHVHTTASDGAVPPAGVVAAAVEARLDVIAVTDHDTTAGVPSAIEAAEGQPIQVIPALEISATHQGREIHVLGYFVDLENERLVEHGRMARGKREARIRAMVDRLGAQGVDVDSDAVLAVAGPDRASVGRPHLARALVDAGYAESVHDAFDRLIGDDHPAFIPTQLMSPWEAVETIEEAGGLAVWAHPPLDLVEPLLPRFVQTGLRGLEVYRPKNRPEVVLRLERLARTHGLVVSGGSDWHGPEAGVELGDFYVSADEVAQLIEAGGL